MYDELEAWELYCEESEEKFEKDVIELFRIARDMLGDRNECVIMNLDGQALKLEMSPKTTNKKKA